MICVQRKAAISLPLVSSLSLASQTCVVRPPWRSSAVQATAPSGAVPVKLHFNPTVVKPDAPSG